MEPYNYQINTPYNEGSKSRRRLEDGVHAEYPTKHIFQNKNYETVDNFEITSDTGLQYWRQERGGQNEAYNKRSLDLRLQHGHRSEWRQNEFIRRITGNAVSHDNFTSISNNATSRSSKDQRRSSSSSDYGYSQRSPSAGINSYERNRYESPEANERERSYGSKEDYYSRRSPSLSNESYRRELSPDYSRRDVQNRTKSSTTNNRNSSDYGYSQRSPSAGINSYERNRYESPEANERERSYGSKEDHYSQRSPNLSNESYRHELSPDYSRRDVQNRTNSSTSNDRNEYESYREKYSYRKRSVEKYSNSNSYNNRRPNAGRTFESNTIIPSRNNLLTYENRKRSNDFVAPMKTFTNQRTVDYTTISNQQRQQADEFEIMNKRSRIQAPNTTIEGKLLTMAEEYIRKNSVQNADQKTSIVAQPCRMQIEREKSPPLTMAEKSLIQLRNQNPAVENQETVGRPRPAPRKNNVILVPKNFPFNKLSVEENLELKTALLGQSETHPFEVFCRKKARTLHFICSSRNDVEWIKESYKNCSPWHGTELKLIEINHAPPPPVAIYTDLFPNHAMTQEQQQKLTQYFAAIMLESPNEKCIELVQLVQKRGKMIIHCNNRESLDWLTARIRDNKQWEGNKLIMIPSLMLPKYYQFEVFLPKIHTDVEKAFARLDRQNDDMKTKTWYVLNKVTTSTGIRVSISVEEDVMKAFEIVEFKPFLDFGRIEIKKTGSN